MQKKWIGIIVGVLALGVLGIIFFKNNLPPQEAPKTETKKLQITTSFYPLYFFASQIAGDKALVYNITPAGAEPHDYEPTAQDLARIEDSQLLVLNGGKLEAWGDEIKNSLQNTKTAIISVGDVFANQNVVEDGETIRDPHVWLDPVLAKKEAHAIAEELIKLDSANSEYYKNNLENLENKLDTLHTKYKAGLANCQKKDIITSHTAFQYMAREYGFNQVAISGLSPDEEPSSKQLADVTAFAKENQVKYIFFESLVSPKLSETIAHEVGAQTLVLNPIEGLAPEEMRSGKNYFTEMEQNLANLKIALECK